MTDTLEARVVFTRTHNGLGYTDALYYPLDAIPDQTTIDAHIAARVASWIDAIENAPPSEEPVLAIDPILIAIVDALDTTGAELSSAQSLEEARAAGEALTTAVAEIRTEMVN